MPVNKPSEMVRERFVGREDALKAFYLRFTYRSTKNCIFYYGEGGAGKTWLLKRIMQQNQGEPDREILPLIDFFDTNNHSKRGLQVSIKTRLDRPSCFEKYDDLIAALEIKIKDQEPAHPSVLANLEKQADKEFIEACQNAVTGRELVFLFDTFERVQHQDAGKWMVDKFLPQVKSPVVAIASRPIQLHLKLPDNVLLYELKGLDRAETGKYARELDYRCSDNDINTIFEHTNGMPLMIDLVINLRTPARDEVLAKMAKLAPGVQVQDSFLKEELVHRYGQPDEINRIIWVMTYFKRRFDVNMLHYVVDHLKRYFGSESYDHLYEKIKNLIIVKEYPELESHLLHDEVQRLIDECILAKGNPFWDGMKDDVYKLIIDHYYPEVLSPAADALLQHQLQTEQLGYLLDQDVAAGITKYLDLRGQTEANYDFEELLWGEVRGFHHLDSLTDHGFEIFDERGRWLQNHNRYQQAEDHFQEMLGKFKNDPEQVEISLSLGYMLLRQGKLNEARDILLESRHISEINSNSRDLARIDNSLGQVALRSGQWPEALEHYAHSFRTAGNNQLLSEKISVFINRGFLYSLQGHYDLAKDQCWKAINLLQTLPPSNENTRRLTFAWMNLGTAYRHSGGTVSDDRFIEKHQSFEEAKKYYCISEELARESKNFEVLCNVWQHLGINEHMIGRQIRRYLGNTGNTEIVQACQHQLQAWRYITDALDLAQKSDWGDAIVDGLNRLAKVYREIYHFDRLASLQKMDPDFQEALEKLKEAANSFQMAFEIEHEHELVFPGSFQSLNWREKTARLFDVSALVAEEVNDFHRVLDSLSELSHVLLWLRKLEQAELVIKRVERAKGYDYQEPLFAATAEILRGELDIYNNRFKEAKERYKQAYINLARETGYSTYILNDRMRDLEWRIREDVPVEQRKAWCDEIEDAWIEAGISTSHPEMIDRIEKLRAEFIQ
jgi:tetratricopeptide (TPR) repeat protein